MGVSSRAAEWPTLGLDETGAGELAWPLRWGAEASDVDWNAEMRSHGQRVIVSLLARGFRPARAKELAQEAWMRVIEQRRAGRLPELKLPGVVLAQANFLALDERRRNEERYPHDPLVEADQEEPGGLERRVFAREQLRTVQAILDRAHPNARRVFFMMYGGEARTAHQIADVLGLSVQRVRQIACELRQRIRDALDGGADVSG